MKNFIVKFNQIIVMLTIFISFCIVDNFKATLIMMVSAIVYGSIMYKLGLLSSPKDEIEDKA